MTVDEPDWLSILRELDEPLPPREPFPPIESFLRPGSAPGQFCLDQEAVLSAMRARPDLLGSHIGWEVPRDFDREATQARFDRLAERLGEAGPNSGQASDMTWYTRFFDFL